MYQIWNGGKISSMFVYKNNKYNDNLEFTSNEAKEAFYNGKWFLKVHGSCCAIDIVNKIPYQRVNLPNKSIPPCNIKLEKGCQPTVLIKDGKETHNYSWQPFEEPNKIQKLKKRNYLDEIWKLTEAFSNEKCKTSSNDFILVEFCGLKFQKTPNINKNIVIVEHLKQEFNPVLKDGTNIRCPILVKKYLSEHAIEGFICSHPVSNKRFKIRSNMFSGEKLCLHDQLHRYWIKYGNNDKFNKYLDDSDNPKIYSI